MTFGWEPGFSGSNVHCEALICLLSTHNLGKDKEEAINHGGSDGGRTVWVPHSGDNGVTWSKPVNISATTKLLSWT